MTRSRALMISLNLTLKSTISLSVSFALCGCDIKFKTYFGFFMWVVRTFQFSSRVNYDVIVSLSFSGMSAAMDIEIGNCCNDYSFTCSSSDAKLRTCKVSLAWILIFESGRHGNPKWPPGCYLFLKDVKCLRTDWN